MTTPTPELAALQHWLQAVISHPAGVGEGIASAEAQSHVAVDESRLESVILPSKALGGRERLAVYSTAYQARLLECMRELFPALRYALDDDVFDHFAVVYLASHPPRSHTLAVLADRFQEFLIEARRRLAPATETWPDFMIDLARLERSIDEVFDGPGEEHRRPLTAEEIERIDPRQWPQARLTPASCLRLLTFRYPVHDYYTAWRELDRQSKVSLPIPAPGESHVALTRRNFVVRRHALQPIEHSLLAALIAGEPVGEAIAAASANCDDPSQLASDLGRWFQAWTAAGFFTSIDVPS